MVDPGLDGQQLGGDVVGPRWHWRVAGVGWYEQPQVPVGGFCLSADGQIRGEEQDHRAPRFAAIIDRPGERRGHAAAERGGDGLGQLA